MFLGGIVFRMIAKQVAVSMWVKRCLPWLQMFLKPLPQEQEYQIRCGFLTSHCMPFQTLTLIFTNYLRYRVNTFAQDSEEEVEQKYSLYT
jgi:hypothetical protein